MIKKIQKYPCPEVGQVSMVQTGTEVFEHSHLKYLKYQAGEMYGKREVSQSTHATNHWPSLAPPTHLNMECYGQFKNLMCHICLPDCSSATSVVAFYHI